MNKWGRIGLVILVTLAAVATGIYWFGYPQVSAYSPGDQSDMVPAGTSISIEFSRKMRPEMVIERLEVQPEVEFSLSWVGNTLLLNPLQAWKAGDTIRINLGSGARAAGLLALPIREETSWSFTIRRPQLAFLFPANIPANIYALDLVSMISTPLTEHELGVEDFSVDEERSRIFYSVKNEMGGSSIYSLDFSASVSLEGNAENSPVEQVLLLDCQEASCRSPVVSPSGDFLAFERTETRGFPQVWLMSIADSSSLMMQPEPDLAKNLILAGDPTHQTLMPAWSVDGLLAYYDTQAAAFVLFEPRSNERVLFPNQTGQAGAWHPEGRDFLAPEIIFLETGSVTGLQSFASSHLIKFDRLSRSTLDLTASNDVEDSYPAYSPDGIYLAFARKYLDQQRWTPGRQLWIMLAGSDNAQPVTDDPYYNHYDLAWSLDSKQLAYVRFNQAALTSPPEIWLLDLISAEKSPLVENAYLPQWIP